MTKPLFWHNFLIGNLSPQACGANFSARQPAKGPSKSAPTTRLIKKQDYSSKKALRRRLENKEGILDIIFLIDEHFASEASLDRLLFKKR